MQELKEVAWQEFDRNDRVTTKTKEFKTEKALDRFLKKLVEKNNFYRIIGYR